MRFSAILIGIIALGLISCSVDPGSKINARAELANLAGPDVGSMQKTMQAQSEAAVASGDFKRAAGMYKQLTDKYPDNKDYKIALADCLRRSGDNEDAYKSINDFIKKNPNDAGALEVKGLILMNLGEMTEASKTFDQVMNIDGKRWRTLNALGIMFAIKKMNNQAISYYNEALAVSPDNPSVLNNLGLAFAMDKQYDTSIETFIHAKHLLPSGSPEVRRIDLNLALVYAIAGKLDEAEEAAAPHLSKAELYNNMGFYSYLQKNNDLAKSYLNMALTQDPIYYERAWKNLSAINGDNGSEPEQMRPESAPTPNSMFKETPEAPVAPAKASKTAGSFVVTAPPVGVTPIAVPVAPTPAAPTAAVIAPESTQAKTIAVPVPAATVPASGQDAKPLVVPGNVSSDKVNAEVTIVNSDKAAPAKPADSKNSSNLFDANYDVKPSDNKAAQSQAAPVLGTPAPAPAPADSGSLFVAPAVKQ